MFIVKDGTGPQDLYLARCNKSCEHCDRWVWGTSKKKAHKFGRKKEALATGQGAVEKKIAEQIVVLPV